MNKKIGVGKRVIYEGKVYKVAEVFSSGQLKLQSLEIDHKFLVSYVDVKLFDEADDAEESLHEKRSFWLQSVQASPEEVALAGERSKVLYELHCKKITRTQAMAILGVSKSTLTRWLKRYNPECGSLSLLRNARGRKKGARLLLQKQEDIIAANIKKHYKGPAASIAQVYKYTDSQCTLLGLPTPSPDTIKNRIKDYGEREIHRMKYGADSARDEFGATPHSFPVETILSNAQADHTQVDIIIVDDDREPLCRPWITMIIDLKSRVILGYYISLNPPDATSVAMALVSACFPKDKLPPSLGGTTLEWTRFRPWGKPKVLGTDNAAEFTSPEFQADLQRHDIEPKLRPIGKKHYGGHIERVIGTFMGEVHFLPGTTYSNAVQKGDYDPEKHSALKIDDFNEWMGHKVSLYHDTFHKGLQMRTPVEVWEEELGKLGPGYVPELMANPKKFMLDFFPKITRVVSKKGVLAFNHYFWSPVFNRKIKESLTFKYDPSNFTRLWWFDAGRYYEVPLANKLEQVKGYAEYYAKSYLRTSVRKAGGMKHLESHQLRLDTHEAVLKAVKKTKKYRAKQAHIAEREQEMLKLDQSNNETEDSGVKEINPDAHKKVKLKWSR
ncbi:helix-turn-helix domain-containing protein [Pseudomonas sp. xss_1]|uniref:helix-turn-helix domain-containing protein n=1 Tax=Pseudomonas sp. xss_1 TaxID=3367214 RepID=UPI00370B91E1